MSYEQYIVAPYVVNVAMREDYQNIYYYDGQISPVSSTSTTEKQAAIYESKLSSSSKQERLSAISIFTDLSNIDVKIEIHKNLTVNPSDINDVMNNPEKTPAVHTTIAHIGTAGFHTLDLNEPVNLEQGEYFSIVISSEDANKRPIAVCRPDGNSTNDMTYYYVDGEWKSYKAGGSNYVSKIRAITNVVDIGENPSNDLKYARIEIENRIVPYEKGQDLIPNIEVYFDEELLRKDVDYDVKVENNDSPGRATLTITGKDRFTGSRTTCFEVTKAKYPPGRLSGTITVYNGTNKLSDIKFPLGWTLYGNDEQLEVGLSKTKYMLRYDGSDKNLYENLYCEFSVNKKEENAPDKIDISDANVEILGKYLYTGNSIVPRVKVTYQGEELNYNTDYQLTFQKNTDAGTATVTITGSGNYKGQKNQDFKISQAKWPEGKPKSTIIVDKDVKNLNEIILENGWSWQKTFDIKSDKTQAVAVYNGTDKKNFANTKMLVTITRGSGTVKKNIATISELRLEQTEYVYNGQAKQPTVIAKDGEKTLELNKDFEVRYQSNTNAGQASVIVTGLNNYTGSRTFTFNIARADRDDFKVILPGWTYGQTAQEPHTEGHIEAANVTYSYSDSRDGSYSPEKPIKAGTYWVKAMIDESRNYNSAENITQFTISKADNPPNMPSQSMIIERKAKTLQDVLLHAEGWQWETPSMEITGESMTATAVYSDKENYEHYTVQITLTKEPRKDASLLSVDLDVKSFVYNGSERKPNVIVKDGDTTLTPGVDYDVRYENNKYAGRGKAVVTFKNDYTGSAEIEFTIGKAEKPNVSDTTIRLDHKVAILSDVPLPNDYVWKNGNIEITGNRMTAIAVYTGDDASSYETTELTFEIIIEEKQNPTEEPKRDDLIWLAIGIPVAILTLGVIVGLAVVKRKRKK